MIAEYKTKRVSQKEAIALGLALASFPSAGPNPSISGMKKLFWGMGAKVIKCGQYAYSVDWQTYQRA